MSLGFQISDVAPPYMGTVLKTSCEDLLNILRNLPVEKYMNTLSQFLPLEISIYTFNSKYLLKVF
jgi:hypothetical protein